MALNSRFSIEAANAAARSLTALANGGYLRIYSGAQPEMPDAPVESQTLLAELRFAQNAFQAPVLGIAHAAPLVADTNAASDGEPAWFRVFKSDGMSALWDGSAGQSDCDLIVQAKKIVSGAMVEFKSLTYTQRR